MLPPSNPLSSPPPPPTLKKIPPHLSTHTAIVMPEEQMQGEVLWPSLVANKLFNRSSGGDCFVADFSSSTESPTSSDHDQKLLKSPSQNRKKEHTMFVGTWNVGGVPPTDDLNLEDWLDTSKDSYDIYVIGFQEIVPLTAKHILGLEKKRISSEWNSLIRSTLNKSLSRQQISSQEPRLGENQKVHPLKDGTYIAQEFRCIVSKQMVGILVSVWVRGDLHGYIQHPSVSCIGCGIVGCLGNKGAVSVRFFLHETSFCVVCCHLASGGKEGDEMHRNSNAMEIFSRTSFSGGSNNNLPQKILDHDTVILLGDLNYRISLSEAKTRSLVEQKEWNILLEKDQLRGEMSEGRIFGGWFEGAITFEPTYKYSQNSDQYFGCVQGRIEAKRRAPAWCDRILWHGKGLKQIQYDRSESRLSDHRPVKAIFISEVKLRRNSNSLAKLLLTR